MSNEATPITWLPTPGDRGLVFTLRAYQPAPALAAQPLSLDHDGFVETLPAALFLRIDERLFFGNLGAVEQRLQRGGGGVAARLDQVEKRSEEQSDRLERELALPVYLYEAAQSNPGGTPHAAPCRPRPSGPPGG